MAASPRHGVGPNGSRTAALPLLYFGRWSLLCYASKWQVPRRRCRSPASEYLLLEEKEDGGLDCFFKFMDPYVIPVPLWV
jgi:hypothetical protein